MTICRNTFCKPILFACIYLGALFLSVIVLWWTVIFGDNPIRVGSPSLIGRSGFSLDTFTPGETVAVKNKFCSEKKISVGFFPSLSSRDGTWIPIPGGVTTIDKGCRDFVHEFSLPPLAPGEYKYAATVKYQTNLVGRDDTISIPPVVIVVPAHD